MKNKPRTFQSSFPEQQITPSRQPIPTPPPKFRRIMLNAEGDDCAMRLKSVQESGTNDRLPKSVNAVSKERPSTPKERHDKDPEVPSECERYRYFTKDPSGTGSDSFPPIMHINKSNIDNPQGPSEPPHQVGVTTMLEMVTEKMKIYGKHETELIGILSQLNTEASQQASVS